MKMEEFIKNLPKAELNIHIEGTLEPDLMMSLGQRNKIKLPFLTLEEARQAYRFKDLQSFLDLYDKALAVLITEQDFYDLTWHYLQKANSQQIRHAEIFFDPQAHLNRGIKFETIVTGIYRALQEGEKKLNLSSHLMMSFMRDLSEDAAQEVFTQALAFKDWIIAVGLNSAEMGNPPEKFKEVFARAREHGFLTVANAGEVGPPEYIWQAIDVLKVSRIDHGVRCLEDPDLVTKLAATQIPLNVCPISNIMLGIFPSMKQHPLKKMYDEGLFVTINSDDPAYFDAYLNENFMSVSAALKLNKSISYELAKNSFNASFLSHDRKQKLINELDKFYKQACKEA